jgi:hypothetical protein
VVFPFQHPPLLVLRLDEAERAVPHASGFAVGEKRILLSQLEILLVNERCVRRYTVKIAITNAKLLTITGGGDRKREHPA